VAVDMARNREDAPTDPDASTTVDASPPVTKMSTLDPYPKKANITINWSAIDSTSGVTNYTVYVSEDGAIFEQWLTNVTEKTGVYKCQEGHQYQFYARARDNAGNFEDAPDAESIPIVRIDITAPQTTAVMTGTTFGSNPVYFVPTTKIALSAKDNYTGVTNTYYSLDGQPGRAFAQALGSFAPGSHTLSYWSVDAAGNIEKRQSLWFSIDTDTPVTMLTIDGPNYALGMTVYITPDTKFTLDASDGGSGINWTRYHFDNLDESTYSGPFSFDKPGPHTLYFGSADNLGTMETPNTRKVSVDRSPPLTTAVAPVDAQRETVTITLTAADTGCGVCGTFWRIGAPDGTYGDWSQGTDVAVEAQEDHSADGIFTVEFYSVDFLGNTEAARSVQVRIDTTTTLTLKLKGPVSTEKGVYTISGKAEPGSRVSVGSRNAVVDADGSFSFDMTLLDGRNTVTVTSIDPAGNTASLTRTITYAPPTETPMTLYGLAALGLLCLIAVIVVAVLARPKRMTE